MYFFCLWAMRCPRLHSYRLVDRYCMALVTSQSIMRDRERDVVGALGFPSIIHARSIKSPERVQSIERKCPSCPLQSTIMIIDSSPYAEGKPPDCNYSPLLQEVHFCGKNSFFNAFYYKGTIANMIPQSRSQGSVNRILVVLSGTCMLGGKLLVSGWNKT